MEVLEDIRLAEDQLAQGRGIPHEAASIMTGKRMTFP